ncbi:DUF5709 domain-containing protein [Streptomyces sp. NPDC051320]|uniref:DUF5709 domain-containing protein n=1 Tax=Streptomyces sp. NPDC051320 TaxID=3154644 RepID=UPI0034130BE8
MSDGTMGDDVYQPTGTNEEQEDATPLDMEDALDENDYDETLDKGFSPPERPFGVNKAGTTAREQREGESLDERLSEEVPDAAESADDTGDGLGDAPDTDGELVDTEAGAERSGRLLAPDQGIERPIHDDVEGQDVGIDGAAASAEEAAVHVVDDPEQPPERSV